MLSNVGLAQMMFNTPLMLDQAKADILAEIVSQKFAGVKYEKPDTETKIDFNSRYAGTVDLGDHRDKRYVITIGGTAIIPVFGSLVQRSFFLSAASGLTSYNHLKDLLIEAAFDADVKQILLENDSPGGSVAGLFDLCDIIKEIDQDIKPVYSIANEASMSASYAISAACRKIFAPRTAQVGSIGVVIVHADVSKRNKKAGIDYTVIQAGSRKTEFSSLSALSDQAKERLKKEIDALHRMFATHVSNMRNMPLDAVYETEAGVFNAKDSIELGLIDEIATLDQAVEGIEKTVSTTARVAAHHQQQGALSMSIKERTNAATEPSAAVEQTFTQADIDAAEQRGATNENARISAILNSEEAKTRSKSATKLALNMKIDAETAAGLLSDLPDEAENAVAQHETEFEKHMRAIGNPDVGASVEDSDEEEGLTARAARIASMVA